jgi:hypothetical protein
MTVRDDEKLCAELLEFRREFYQPLPQTTVAEWAEANLVLSERQTESPGPLSFASRPYAREVLESFRDRSIEGVTLVFGSQSGKSLVLMVGAAWTMTHEPRPILWVLPNQELARSFSKTRWQPLVDESKELRRQRPASGHDYTNLEQHFAKCTLNFVGSNSPASISSRPVGLLVADEVDKFAPASSKEASALELAEQRVKAFTNSKVVRASTPTTVDGEIWQRYLLGDQRRFFVPCIACGQAQVLEWKGVVWDDQAKDEAGQWIMPKVKASARYRCAHCKTLLTDPQKFAMIRKGEWRPTNPNAAPGERSFQLSSLYSPDRKCTLGALAVKFLQGTKSILGLQSFVSGDLAEPWENQTLTKIERTELISERMEVKGEWRKLMTVDCQARAPYFWAIVRAWTEGKSEAVFAGSFNSWEEVERIQAQHAVPDVGVLVDSGFGSRSDVDVYSSCVKHCEIVTRTFGQLPSAIGWQPCKGFPSRRRWRDDATGLWLPYFLRPTDPFLGTANAGQVEILLFEFSADFFKDLLELLRRQQGPHRWTVGRQIATDVYWQHLDGETKEAVRNPRTGKTSYVWKKRSSHWPNHLFDCEVMQLAGASFYGLLDLGEPEPEPAGEPMLAVA